MGNLSNFLRQHEERQALTVGSGLNGDGAVEILGLPHWRAIGNAQHSAIFRYLGEDAFQRFFTGRAAFVIQDALSRP